MNGMVNPVHIGRHDDETQDAIQCEIGDLVVNDKSTVLKSACVSSAVNRALHVLRKQNKLLFTKMIMNGC